MAGDSDTDMQKAATSAAAIQFFHSGTQPVTGGPKEQVYSFPRGKELT